MPHVKRLEARVLFTDSDIAWRWSVRLEKIEHMFERAPTTAADLRWFVGALGRLDDRVGDAERVDQIRLLEEIKSAAAAAQATVTSDFVASLRAAQVQAGVAAGEVGAGIAAQVALAKRESPARARSTSAGPGS